MVKILEVKNQKLTNMTLTAIEKISVSEFLERDDFEEGYIYELINGIIMRRASPHAKHQDAVLNIAAMMRTFVKENKLGKCYVAPLDVSFEDFDLTQPDVFFISNDRLHIVDKYIDGAPDLVVEVLSKGTTKIDRNDKMKIYRKFGVSEYWIVDYQKRTVEVYALINNDYEMVFLAEETGTIQSVLLEGLKMDLDDIFD